VPHWGARLEGLRASRRTATSEIVPAAMLRDASQRLHGAATLLSMRPSRRSQDEVCGFKLRLLSPVRSRALVGTIETAGPSAAILRDARR
jgi:hypothetical protein